MNLGEKDIADLKKMAEQMGEIQSSASKSIDIAQNQIKEIAGEKYEKVLDLQNRLIKAILEDNKEMQESIENDLKNLLE